MLYGWVDYIYFIGAFNSRIILSDAKLISNYIIAIQPGASVILK